MNRLPQRGPYTGRGARTNDHREQDPRRPFQARSIHFLRGEDGCLKRIAMRRMTLSCARHSHPPNLAHISHPPHPACQDRPFHTDVRFSQWRWRDAVHLDLSLPGGHIIRLQPQIVCRLPHSLRWHLPASLIQRVQGRDGQMFGIDLEKPAQRALKEGVVVRADDEGRRKIRCQRPIIN